jgi:hypothetical protein
MRLHWNAIAPLGLAIMAAATVAAPTSAQDRPLDGTYTYLEAESDPIKPAIERAVARMNFITRPVARGRLTKTNSPYQSLSIRQSNSQISIVTDQRAPIVSPGDGSPIKWTREDGEVFDVTTRWVGGTLEQTFVADDGQRKNVYALGADGSTLEMRVTVTSPRLAQPLTYTLRYRRQS